MSTEPVAVQRALAYARAQIGKPYVWGGVGPEGFDCSGLVMRAYEYAGITLPRTTFEQIDVGTGVSPSDTALWLPGDLIFPYLTHVQLWVGDGQIIEAPAPGLLVRQCNSWAAIPVLAVRRVVSQHVAPPSPPKWPGTYLELRTPWIVGYGTSVWQARLNVVSSARLVVDGVFGPLTEAATRSFQEKAMVVVDGIVGPITWDAAWR